MRQLLYGRAPLYDMTASNREDHMAESIYKVIELIGTSTESWEAAGRAAVERATAVAVTKL